MKFEIDERAGAVHQAFFEVNRSVDTCHQVDVINVVFPPNQGHLPRAGVGIVAYTCHAFTEQVIASHSGKRWDLVAARYVRGDYSESFEGPSFVLPEPAISADYAVARKLTEYAIERLSDWPGDTPRGWYYGEALFGRPRVPRATPVEVESKLESVLSELVRLEASEASKIASRGDFDGHP